MTPSTALDSTSTTAASCCARAPAAPATPAALFTVEVGEPTRDSDLFEQAIGLEPNQMRYPAPKRSVAKKRR